MRLALLAIMLDEADYLERWVRTAVRAAAPGTFDRVLVLDGGSSDGTPERLRELGVEVAHRRFTGDFADQRNHAASLVADCDWVFELDADEVPSQPLLGGLRAIVGNAVRANMGCVGIARFNLLDGTLQRGPGHRGLDYQYRLRSSRCRWRGAVHEEVDGYGLRYELKIEDGQFIVHDKSSARHEARNAYYRTIAP